MSVGVEISFGTTVASVFVDDDAVPTVKLDDGTELKSDVIVGADGTKSLVREVVTQRADDGVDSGHSFYMLVLHIVLTSCSLVVLTTVLPAGPFSLKR